MSTIKVNTIQTTGGVEVYTAKAWVNFQGSGTVTIRSSGNVSSITDNGVGLYTANFSNTLSSADYAATRNIDYDSAAGSGALSVSEVLSATASSIQVSSEASTGARYDCLRCDMVVAL